MIVNMSDALLFTKFFIPPPRHELVPRPRLIERLNEGLLKGNKLTLISAPAGFGKTTLASLWLESITIPIAWLSLDERDKDPARFLTYLIAALQNIRPGIGLNLQAILQSPQPLHIENILTLLINEITANANDFLVVLDDYHSLDSLQVDHAMEFLIDHQPAQMHLVIATREDPDLPLARLRARGQCCELRAADLQFTPVEASEFLNQVMGLNLSDGDVAALETRTEGWIAGLQMAAISMHGLQDMEGFIQSFTGSHRFVMDYLIEEVIRRQNGNIQTFLQKTSILDRMCGSLCDAILQDPSGSSQSILEYLERANLFIIPQDNERHWYRYHHLFSSLLRKRLGQSLAHEEIIRLNIIASEWYENNDMTLEAFRHAAAANDIERAMRLMESGKMPMQLRGTVTTILDWLVSLPTSILNAQPSLLWKQAEMLLLSGRFTEVEEKLEAAEAALVSLTPSNCSLDDTTRGLIGKIAAIRSNLAVGQQKPERILAQANRALQDLQPDQLSYRSSAIRDMGFANIILGNRAEARRNFTESLSVAKVSGDMVEPLLSTIGLAQVYEMENQLCLADECYQRILPEISDYSMLNTGVVYLGMARIHYQWNILDIAEKFGEQSLQLAQQFSQIISRVIMSKVFLAHLKLARGEVESATVIVTQAEQIARQQILLHLMPNIVAVKVRIWLCQGNLTAAEELTQQYDLPMSRARVLLAQGNPSDALKLLELFRQQMEEKDWQDERLRAVVLQAVALYLSGDKKTAVEVLGEALVLAEPNGFIRLFLDEGVPMAELLSTAAAQAIHQDYVTRLLTAFEPDLKDKQTQAFVPGLRSSMIGSALVEPLSPREFEILRLLAKGLSNQQICERLYLALDTVKGHNRKIFDKLNVNSRSEAIARAHELNLL